MSQPEPSTIRAKTSLSWDRTISDYSANDDYVARYEFRSAAGAFNIDATGTGNTFSVSRTPAQTSEYDAGEYAWNLYILKGADLDNPDERHWVACGNATVVADTSSVAAHDPRSQVKKTLDAIEAMIAGKAGRDVQEYSIQTGSGQRALKHIPITELIPLRDKYAGLYQQELNALRIANGGRSGKTIRVRFSD